MRRRFGPVAVVGAGPAGSMLAARLARAGVEVLLFHDPSLPKHCGGGIPPRACDRIPLLRDLRAPRLELRGIAFSAPPSAPSPPVPLPRPLLIYDRARLDGALRAEAEGAGARLVASRVARVRREGNGWAISAGETEHRAGYLVGADGAAGIVRRTLSRPFPPAALSLCAGYYLASPPDPESVAIGFTGIPGSYCWIFPRPGRASAGIVAPLPGNSRESLLASFRAWFAHAFPDCALDTPLPYAAVVPAPGRLVGRAAGAGWALVGDAAGTAAPITREGIYFAAMSSLLLASLLERGRAALYPALLRLRLLLWHRLPLLLERRFCGERPARRFVSLLAASDSARRAVGDFISGPMRYGSLAAGLLRSALTR